MTQIVPQTQDITVHDDDDLSSLLTRIASRKVVAEPDVPHKEPKVIPVSPGQQLALKHVTRDLGTTELPHERRLLSDDEKKKITVLVKDVKTAEKVLATAVAAVKTAVFNHLDVGLESDNDEDLPYDEKSGHYLVAGEIVVPDAGLRLCRELSQGTPELTAEHILSLYEDGKITREEYLKATKQVRILDEEGLLKVLRKRPDLIEDIDEVIEPGKVTAKFCVREVKKGQDASQ